MAPPPVCLYAGAAPGGGPLALRYEDIHRDTRTITVDKAVEFVGNQPQLKCPKTEAGIRSAILLDPLAEAIPAGGRVHFRQPARRAADQDPVPPPLGGLLCGHWLPVDGAPAQAWIRHDFI